MSLGAYEAHEAQVLHLPHRASIHVERMPASHTAAELLANVDDEAADREFLGSAARGALRSSFGLLKDLPGTIGVLH